MSELSGLYAVWYRELKTFIREKSRIVSSIINPLMWLLILGTGLGASISIQNANYQTFIYPGILVMSILFSSIFFGAYIVWDKRIDFMKEMLVAPLSRTTIFFGKVIGGATDAMIQSLILIALGFFFGIHFTPLMFLYTMLILFVVTVGITSIGLIIGAMMSSPEGFGLLTSFVIFPIFFLSGALFPVENLPGWLYIFVRINPEAYAVDALRWVILGTHTFSALLDASVITVFALVMVLIGTKVFDRMKV